MYRQLGPSWQLDLRTTFFVAAELYILKAFYRAKDDLRSLEALDGDTVVDVKSLCRKNAFVSDPDSTNIAARCSVLWMRDISKVE